MTRCSVNSSDLASARELSRRLLGTKLEFLPALAPVPPPPQVPPPAPPPAPDARPNPVIDLHAPPLDLESWEVFLAWGLELCRARAGFVVDSQGFVVATRGNVPADQFSGLGAELAYAMEQLDRIDVEAGSLMSIELQFASRRLMAVRLAKEGVGSIVIGFVGSRPLADDVREGLVRQATYSLDRLV
jgi:hypothetical protein